MEGSNGLPNHGTSLNPSRQTLLPHIGSLRHVPSSYANSQYVGTEAVQNPMAGQGLHQRSSSESFLLEQPSWHDDLLYEPEITLHKGHRRSSSDSSAYLGRVAKIFSTNEEDSKRSSMGPSLGSRNWGHGHVNQWHASKGHSPDKDIILTLQNAVLLLSPNESAGLSSQKGDHEHSGFQDHEESTGKINAPQTEPSVSKEDAKRAKQQSTHRSRVRKLQYITALERNVQVLQAEGSEASDALEFLDQQNLILGMENRALRRQLDSLTQEHLIKHMETDMLAREITRLEALYQLQQQQKHCQNKRRELDAQFVNPSINFSISKVDPPFTSQFL